MPKAHPECMAILRKKSSDDDLFVFDPQTGQVTARTDPATGLPFYMSERVATAPTYVEALRTDPKLVELRAKVADAEAELAVLQAPLGVVQDHETDVDALAGEFGARAGRIHALEQVLPARRRAVVEREVKVLSDLLEVDQDLAVRLGEEVQAALVEQAKARAVLERASWRATVLSGNMADAAGSLSRCRRALDEIDAKHGWA